MYIVCILMVSISIPVTSYQSFLVDTKRHQKMFSKKCFILITIFFLLPNLLESNEVNLYYSDSTKVLLYSVSQAMPMLWSSVYRSLCTTWQAGEPGIAILSSASSEPSQTVFCSTSSTASGGCSPAPSTPWSPWTHSTGSSSRSSSTGGQSLSPGPPYSINWTCMNLWISGKVFQ